MQYDYALDVIATAQLLGLVYHKLSTINKNI